VQHSRSITTLLQRTDRIIGTWVQIASDDVIDALGAAEYDFTIIDCEHGAFGIETAERLIRSCEAANVVPFVRVPRGDTAAIYKALDAGAVAVLAPSVESAEEAQELVAYTRFAPEGKRGACPIVRAAQHSALAWQAFVAEQDECGLVPMIETVLGVANANAICAVSGLKAVLIGPFDLSVSMGHAGDDRHIDVQTAIERVIDAAKLHRLPVIMPVFAPQKNAMATQLSHWAARGVRAFAIGADKIILTHALRDYASEARKGKTVAPQKIPSTKLV
jgi:4-hydroxy-2-oxoheptanedioate aldolase